MTKIKTYKTRTRKQAFSIAIQVLRKLEKVGLYYDMSKDSHSPLKVYVGSDDMDRALEMIESLSRDHDVEHSNNYIEIYYTN